MRIYSYFNSGTSFRVRIALALKGVSFDYVPVNLREQHQRSSEHMKLNPSAGVPVMSDHDFVLTQSLAIIDYLDTKYPVPRLIPDDARKRARVLELVMGIACDIHPVNNMRVLQYLQSQLGISDAQKQDWYNHWVMEGLSATEKMLLRSGTGDFCIGDQPTLADCCLVPQVFNAKRMGCTVDSFGRVMAIYNHCMRSPAFQAAAPASQPDAPG